MRRVSRSLILSLAAFTACQAQPPAGRDPVTERAAIARTREAYVAAWRAADAPNLAAQYLEDGVVLYPNQPAILGRPAILSYFEGFFRDFQQDSFALASLEVEVLGDWAFDRGEYRWAATPRAGGPALTDVGKYLVILRRRPDGTWGVARDMDNSDRPPAQAGRGPA